MRITRNRVRLATGLLRQFVISTLGLVVSVLIVRLLPSREYANYTIVIAAISGCAVVADSGSGFALLSVAGRFWGDLPQVASVVQAVLRCIRITWPFSVIGFGVWIATALFRIGFTTEAVLFALCILSANSFIGLRTKIWDTLLRLDERQSAVQATQLQEVAGRLGLILLLSALGQAYSLTALAVISLGQIFSYLRLRLYCWHEIGVLALEPTNSNHLREVRSLVLRQLPNSVFFAIQGQLSIGLLSLLSNATNVAEFGALSRYSVASGVIQAFASLYLIPNIARTKAGWVRYLWRSLALVAALASVVPILTVVLPNQMLRILGPAYMSLAKELRLLAFADMLNCILSVGWALLASRGRNYFTWLFIPINLLAQIVGILLLRVDTIEGVIFLSFLSSASLLLILTFEYRRALKVNVEESAA